MRETLSGTKGQPRSDVERGRQFPAVTGGRVRGGGCQWSLSQVIRGEPWLGSQETTTVYGGLAGEYGGADELQGPSDFNPRNRFFSPAFGSSDSFNRPASCHGVHKQSVVHHEHLGGGWPEVPHPPPPSDMQVPGVCRGPGQL